MSTAYDLIDQNLIEPFDKIASSADDKTWLQSFYPGLMANGTIGGHVWGIPFQRSTIVMFYNKDMFRAAGLNPDAPPKTWKEMLAAATKLTGKDKFGLMVPSTGWTRPCASRSSALCRRRSTMPPTMPSRA